MVSVYAIRCVVSGRVYLGQTVDLPDRMHRHNCGKVQSTKKGGPWELIAVKEFANRSEAMWEEKELKRSRGKRLKWLEENQINRSNEPTPRRGGPN